MARRHAVAGAASGCARAYGMGIGKRQPSSPACAAPAWSPMVLDGPTDRDAFVAYVRQILVSDFSPRDIVIADNLSSHKAPAAREIIEAAGAQLLFLPPYSPGFNPIEQASCKLKTHLRKAAAAIAYLTPRKLQVR